MDFEGNSNVLPLLLLIIVQERDVTSRSCHVLLRLSTNKAQKNGWLQSGKATLKY
jgi:hypothetical protein